MSRRLLRLEIPVFPERMTFRVHDPAVDPGRAGRTGAAGRLSDQHRPRADDRGDRPGAPRRAAHHRGVGRRAAAVQRRLRGRGQVRPVPARAGSAWTWAGRPRGGEHAAERRRRRLRCARLHQEPGGGGAALRGAVPAASPIRSATTSSRRASGWRGWSSTCCSSGASPDRSGETPLDRARRHLSGPERQARSGAGRWRPCAGGRLAATDRSSRTAPGARAVRCSGSGRACLSWPAG